MKTELRSGEFKAVVEANAFTPIKYRNMFGRDIFKDVEDARNNNDFKSRVATTMRLITVMSEKSNVKFPDEPEKIYVLLPGVLELWNKNIVSCVESSDGNGTNSRPLTFSLYHLRCVQIGLSVADLKEITVGMVFDLYTEMNNSDTTENVREATQEDMDAF